MAREAATNTSTWRYFHFEKACRLRWKSTLRDATTSGTSARAVRICSAMAVSETAIGSCACTTSGRRSSRTFASCQPAWTSNSLRGAKPRNRRPSPARRRSSPLSWASRMASWPASARPVTVSSTWFWPPRQVRAVSMWSDRISTSGCEPRPRGYRGACGAALDRVLSSAHSFANLRNT